MYVEKYSNEISEEFGELVEWGKEKSNELNIILNYINNKINEYE